MKWTQKKECEGGCGHVFESAAVLYGDKIELVCLKCGRRQWGAFETPAQSAERAINQERTRQDAKWGVQDHAPEWWLAILMEEVGELSEAILETHFDNGTDLGGMENIRREAVHCAAVAKAFVECIERKTARHTYPSSEAVLSNGGVGVKS